METKKSSDGYKGTNCVCSLTVYGFTDTKGQLSSALRTELAPVCCAFPSRSTSAGEALGQDEIVCMPHDDNTTQDTTILPSTSALWLSLRTAGSRFHVVSPSAGECWDSTR